jgi:hypothetical protein
MKLYHPTRRAAIKSSLLGLVTVSLPNVLFAKEMTEPDSVDEKNGEVFYRYPSIDDAIVSQVVGLSHFNLDKVKEFVGKRPELARATWDWGFGDWETALGAASHVGRRDIADYLMQHGARPDIFTYAMLGKLQAVKLMIEATPGIQSIDGPHGISLLQHARNGISKKESLSAPQIAESEQLIAYLESLKNADGRQYLEMTDDKKKYLGDYKYGDGEKEGLTIRLNMREMISLGKLGQFGGALYKIGDNKYIYNGALSVQISFQFENDKVISLTIEEPDLTLKAIKV